MNSATNNQDRILTTVLGNTCPKITYSVNTYETHPSPFHLIWKIKSTTYIFSIA